MEGAAARPSSTPKSPAARSFSRIASGEYSQISFVHEIADHSVEDVTEEILAEAALPEIASPGADLQANRFDHVRDLRKHEAV